MKIDMSKFLPWVLALSILGGSVYTYASTSTSHGEKIRTHEVRINKCENKQDKILEKVSEIEKNISSILTILRRQR